MKDLVSKGGNRWQIWVITAGMAPTCGKEDEEVERSVIANAATESQIAPRYITGEDAIREILQAVRDLDDIDNVVFIYDNIVRPAKLVPTPPDDDDQSGWTDWRIEIGEEVGSRTQREYKTLRGNSR